MNGKEQTRLWVYVSHSDNKIDDVSFELLGKSTHLADIANSSLEAIIIGNKVKKLAEKLLDYGPSTVYYVEDKRLAKFCSPLYAHALAELVKKYKPETLLMGSTFTNESLAARVAAKFNTGLSAHCVDLKFDGQNLVQTVPGFGGNIMANIICRENRPQMATVAQGIFEPRKSQKVGAKIRKEKVTIPTTLRTPKEIEYHRAKPSKEKPLGKAETVVAGGFGVGSKENWKLVEDLARQLNGAVGATRPPVDEGWAHVDQMIGASGKVIKPTLYIGIGISGMMHHTVGIHGSKVIIAINNDPKAPIFNMADYGIIGDFKEIVPTLIHQLKTGEGLKFKLKPTGNTRSPDSFKASLQKMKPNVYKFGQLVENPVEDPRTCRTIEGHAQIFEAAHDPRYQDIVTTISHLTGKRVSRYLSVIQSPEDMFMNSRMKRLIFNLTGTCTGGRCAGWNTFNALWSTTWDMDQDLGTDYHQRLKNWLIDAQERDITLSGALTDPKGHRKRAPSKQTDPDMYLHVIEKRKDGVVVRGAKVMICGIAAANEIFVMPTTNLRQADADYAISFAIPKDTDGITIVESRHPSDGRELEEGFDNPVTKGGITQAYIFFEDVFVPWERVFMCGEYSYAGEAVSRFTLPYRSAIGGCVAGQGDVMIGAAILISRANGIAEKVFRDKLIQMVVNNETTFGLGLAAAVMGTKHPSGCWLPDPIITNVNKVHVATLPYETKRLTQEIAGGIGETGCMPSYKDFIDSRYGHLIQKYLKAHSPAETRARIARLIEWLTLGAGVPGCMHGGGSPDGARMIIYSQSKFDEMIEMAKRIGGISDISLA
ncbi:4-hydroxyphenylacetate 3-hydroxylase N-terminal domain-containing protein [candidate division CSSED10-310 bacterium]|uniref:4-hydroxyphenylacetate 3-hydroxylase N-terminal domain-containing protein n=1 Tax=candidate division CSSED10-310 bacterium TaxID=2855610 RepID=A0ABV6Z2A4_UNCC1